MTSNLSLVNLGSIATFRAGYAFPKKDQGKTDGEIPFIKVSDFNIPGNEYHIIQANNYVSAEYVKERKLKTFPAGTIVFAKIGVALLSDRVRVLTRPTLIDNNLMGCVAKGANEKYLSYILELIHLSRYAEGSALPFLKQSTIEKLSINIHPEEVQNKIANFIGNLDLKIECNNNVIKNLEDLMTCLFYEKCIKEHDRKTSLSKIANFLNGLAMQKFPPTPEDKPLPVLKIRELRQTFCDENSNLCSSKINSQYIVNDGDLIFSWSGSLLVDIWTGGKCGLNQHLFKVTSQTHPKWFVFLWIKFHIDNFTAIAQAKATTMGHIKRSDLDKAEVIYLDKSEIDVLDTIFKPQFNLLINLKLQNKIITKIRDLLLPKLLSGEIYLLN